MRKKNVYVIFATQEVADVVNSPLKTTIIQQCLTKIYLADPSAVTAGMLPVYRAFGLADSEISLIASSTMKRDYFYTSPLGRRLFRLDLGPVTLVLIGAADHARLNRMVKDKEPGSSFCLSILDSKRINYRHLMGADAPRETQPRPKVIPQVEAVVVPDILTKEENKVEHDVEAQPLKAAHNGNAMAADIIKALKALPEYKGKVESIVERLNVSRATVYQARKILKCASEALIEDVMQGRISIKSAYKRLGKER